MAKRSRLRSGFTTGACAAAAAKGATALLLGRPVEEVRLRLPWGDPGAREVPFSLTRPEVKTGSAACGVIKDAGDDPDVTNGVEVRAAIRWTSEPDGDGGAGSSPRRETRPIPVRLEAGPGVGRVTKPGLAVSVGQPAINPVPRRMIEASVREVLEETDCAGANALEVTLSVPGGEQVALRTLNARLGIEGGLSILGTTGIVIPMSTDAWRATIDSALDVARASGLRRVVLAHGRSSEAAAEALFAELPPEAFVLMGDHVGYALEAAADRDLAVVLAGQFAKFCKVADGHFATHVKDSILDLGVVSRLLARAGFPALEARQALGANTAREVFQHLARDGDRGVFRALAEDVARQASQRVGGRVRVAAVLFGYDKAPLARCGT